MIFDRLSDNRPNRTWGSVPQLCPWGCRRSAALSYLRNYRPNNRTASSRFRLLIIFEISDKTEDNLRSVTQVGGTPALHILGENKIHIETFNDVANPKGVDNLLIRYA